MESYREYVIRKLETKYPGLAFVLEEVHLYLYYLAYWELEKIIIKLENFIDSVLENYNLILCGEYKYVKNKDKQFIKHMNIYEKVIEYKNGWILKRKE